MFILGFIGCCLLQVTHAIWSNCGSNQDPFRLENLSIDPGTVTFPEILDLTASAKLLLNETSPIHVRNRYSSVHINESKVLHMTEVSDFLTAHRFLKTDYFNKTFL